MEELFIKEFKTNIRVIGNKNIADIPLPLDCKEWLKTVGKEEYAVKGIRREGYSKLNKTLVKKLPKGFEAKRRVIDKVTRSFKKNEEGKFVYEDYKVPSGSMVVLSEVNLGLSYKDYLKSEEGYGYIDFVKSKTGKITYMYVLPKEVLYKVNQTALVLSLKSSMNCYNGYGYNTWNKGAVYLYVIPYSPTRRYEASIVLKTGHSINFEKEIKKISDYWQTVNFIPDIGLSSLTTGENLCLRNVIVNSDKEYTPIDLLPISRKEIYGEED